MIISLKRLSRARLKGETAGDNGPEATTAQNTCRWAALSADVPNEGCGEGNIIFLLDGT